MFLRTATRSGTSRRRTAIFATSIVAVLSVPAMMYSFDPNPPVGIAYTGSPSGAGSGCAGCHGTLTTPSVLTITAPASYTAGGAAAQISVSIPSSGGFELTILDSTGANAGTFTAGAGSQVSASGGINFVSDSTSGTSWSFTWSPPATAVGTVTAYATGGTHNVSYVSTASITASGTTTGPPTLTVTPNPLPFTATAGSTTSQSQNVSVTASDGSAQTFSAAATVTTPTGGTWLSVGSATGTTPTTTFAVSANPTGLAAGTYNGTVTFTSSGVSNSPVTLPVTLTVGSTTPPPTGQTFSLVVVDRQSGGSDWLLVNGSGSVSSSNTATGSGSFTRFRSGLRESEGSPDAPTSYIVANGTWKITGVTSSASGKVVLQVQLTTTTSSSSSLSTGTMTITSTSSSSGDATLAIDQGSTFNSVGIGKASLTSGSGSGGGTGGGGGDDGPTDH